MQIGPGRQVWTRVKFLLTHLPGIKHVQTEKSAMGQKKKIYSLCYIKGSGRWKSRKKGKLGKEVTQLSPTLCDLMDGGLPVSSVHGILQARILEWVVIPFSRRSSPSRYRTQVLCIARRFFTFWATREVGREPECHSAIVAELGKLMFWETVVAKRDVVL